MRGGPGPAALLAFFFVLAVVYQVGNYLLMSLAGAVGLLAAQAGLLLLPALVFARLYGPGVRQRLGLAWPGWGALAGGAGLALAGFLVLNQIELWSDAIFPMPEDLQRALEQFLGLASGRVQPLLLLGLTAGAGLGEEVLFRGLIQRALAIRVGPGRAILIGALLFAAMHVNPWWFAGLAAVGALLGAIAWVFDSVWPAVVAHAVHNGLAYGLLMACGSEVRPAEEAGPLAVAVSALATAVGLILLARRGKRLAVRGTACCAPASGGAEDEPAWVDAGEGAQPADGGPDQAAPPPSGE